MPIPADLRVARALALCVALTAAACRTSGPAQSAPAPVSESGFSIRERVRVGASVREGFERAVRLLQQEQYEAAIPVLVAVTDAEPRLTAAHIDLGIAYARTGELELAQASLEKALELNARHPVAHNELGLVYRRTGRFEQARRSYETALAAHPDFHFARLNLAILCDVFLADVPCALSNYEQYARTVPGDGTAARWLADLRGRTGR
jgi:tetratricopeptide (TPR) repeat protein